MHAPFRSRLISAFDYRGVNISVYIKPFVPNDSALDEALLCVRKKHARLVEAEVIENGDIVTLRCASDMPRFSKDEVTVRIGAGLFSKELEDALIGMSTGESAEKYAKNARVDVTALKIMRSVLPELTDEFVNASIETVHTVRELTDWFINEQREAYITELAEQAADAAADEAIIKSEFLMDEYENQQVRSANIRLLREHCDFNGIDLDSVSDEQAVELFGFPSAAAYIEWFADLGERDLKTALLGYDLLSRQGRCFSQEEYAAQLEKNAQEAGMRAEELAKDFTYEAYVRQFCSEYYSERLKEYAHEIIKEEMR